MSDPQLETLKKQLRIKTGSTNRLQKEHGLYQKELEDQKIKVDTLVAENGDEWQIKNARRMLLESETMITDSDSRLGKAVEELRGLLVDARKIEGISEVPEFIAAEEALEKVSA
ncbi:tubulin binding cofactor A [Flagelloscypha sp. PMI_526]|nr:tubulin binding cofactor A [Flagelloscypha sp. PMI_526]